MYQNSTLPGSGEYCLFELLTVGAYPKVPLVDRIPKVVFVVDDSRRRRRWFRLWRCRRRRSGDGMEVRMIYGQRDWMDYCGGLEAQRVCRKRGEE